MPTLTQYWSDEVTRIGTALATSQSDLATLRAGVLAAEGDQRDTADRVRSQGDAVAAARRALASIPMPADGDPLLDAMEDALVGLRAAQAALAVGNHALLLQRAQLQRAEQVAQRLTVELAGAKAAFAKATLAAARRQTLADEFGVSGSLKHLVSDALAALAIHQATAAARVEGEFPTSAMAVKDFLGRVRARASLVRDIAAAAMRVEADAWSANNTALAQAQRNSDAALAALQAMADAAPQVAASTAALARLAALPAPNPPVSYSILTPWQHGLLHDSALRTQREGALQLLTAVDTARDALIAPQEAYDKALHGAQRGEPDKTVAQLDATTLSAERGALDAALAALQDARDDYMALAVADREVLDKWFAAVPDNLWAALDALDGATERLEKIGGSPTPGDLILALDNAEVALEAALRADREASRQELGGQFALLGASAGLRAALDSLAGGASAMAHSSTLF